MSRVIIVGGGVGGLAAAIRLSAAGHSVTVLEKNPRVGGKLNLWEAAHPRCPDEPAFRFDTGPSLLTLPQVFQDLFQAAGQKLGGHLKMERLDPISRFCWDDGMRFELRSEASAMLREVARVFPSDVGGFARLMDRAKKIWDLSAEMFLFHAPQQLLKGGGFSARAGFGMLTVPFRIGMFQRYSSVIDRHVREPRLREVLYQYATYAGASPARAPATLAVIPHAELHFGGWHITGGMYRLAEALENLARTLGAQIVTRCAVKEILIEDSAVKGVLDAAGTIRDADAVVCNSDTIYSYRELIDRSQRPHFSDRKLSKLEPGGSGIVLLLGIEGGYPQLAHHNKFMPRDYRSDLRAMFQTKTI
ncbi:MAG: phytoene desaturase family protein, partial [Tepidisphaeraceae bacterium]